MIKIFFQLVRDIARGFVQDRCFSTASALAFSTLFALVPILVLAVLVFSALPVSDAVNQQVETFLFQNFVLDSADTIKQYLYTFIEHSRHLSIVGLFMLICVAILMVFTMARSFDEIWRVSKSRHGLSGFFMYWSVLTLLPVLISVGVFVASNVSAWTPLQGVTQAGTVHTILSSLAPFLLIYVALFLLYLTLPNCKVPLSSALLSSLVATCCFFMARKVYMVYAAHVRMQMDVYGALSVLPAFLTWIYWNWMVVLLGVEVGYHYTLHRQRQQDVDHAET